MMEDKVYRYEMVARPLGMGCQPTGFIGFDDEKGEYGVVEYDRPLTDVELDDYELREWTEDNMLDVFIGNDEVFLVENRDGWVLDVEADNFQDEYFTEAVIRTLDSRVTNEGIMSLEADSKGMVTVPSENMLIYNKSIKHVGYPADYEPSKFKVKDNGMEM